MNKKQATGPFTKNHAVGEVVLTIGGCEGMIIDKNDRWYSVQLMQDSEYYGEKAGWILLMDDRELIGY